MSLAQQFIAAMISPALFILASGSLLAAALLRLGRIMDRIRRLADADMIVDADELNRHERRAHLVNRAVTTLFAAVTLFVCAGITIAADRASGDRFDWLPIGLTLCGMLLIVTAVASLAAESQLSAVQIKAEIEKLRTARRQPGG